MIDNNYQINEQQLLSRKYIRKETLDVIPEINIIDRTEVYSKSIKDRISKSNDRHMRLKRTKKGEIILY